MKITKPCPFCDKIPEKAIIIRNVFHPSGMHDYWEVGCIRIDHSVIVKGDTEDLAIINWQQLKTGK